jgi:hypothetical protein
MAKRGILIGTLALAWLGGAAAADVRSVKTVYLLPMSNGLDQYLASRLASESVFQVVTDPKKADAVLTDHVGESFEKSLDDLYGSTAPKDKDGDDNSATTTFARVGGAIRTRGTYFLVDRNSRDVLWSGQEVPKDSTPKETRRVAARIAERLAKALGTGKNAGNEK